MLINFNHLKTFYSAFKQKIKNSRGNWNQNDPTADDYIKNRPFYSEKIPQVVYVKEQLIEGFVVMEDPIYAIQNPFTFTPVIGNVYKILWDNNFYEVTASELDGLIYIGNKNYVHMLPGGDIPFAIVIVGSNVFVVTESTNSSHKIGIFGRDEIVHQIDKKYVPIPDGIVTEDDIAPVAFSGDYYDLDNAPMDVLQYSEQSLTDEQQAQARENIDVYSKEDIFSNSKINIPCIVWAEYSTTNKANFTFYSGTYYKVADFAPKYSDIDTFDSRVYTRAGYSNQSTNKYNGVNCYQLGAAIIVTTPGECSINETSFTASETGIYFYNDGSTYGVALTCEGNIHELQSNVVGLVRRVNGTAPDGSGNIDIGLSDVAISGSYNDLTDIPEEPTDLLRYSEQTLTDDEKLQARTNIGASDFDGEFDSLTYKPYITQIGVSGDDNDYVYPMNRKGLTIKSIIVNNTTCKTIATCTDAKVSLGFLYFEVTDDAGRIYPSLRDSYDTEYYNGYWYDIRYVDINHKKRIFAFNNSTNELFADEEIASLITSVTCYENFVINDKYISSSIARTSDLSTLSTLVGEKPVAEQIDEAIAEIGDISITTDSELDTTSENPIQNKAVAEKFEALEYEMNNATYKEIGITSFTNNVNTVEIGSIVASATLNWATSKTPTALYLDGNLVENVISNSGSITPSITSLTTNKTWVLRATDERNASKIATTSITFLNGVYYGVINKGVTINSATILDLVEQKQLIKSLQNSTSIEFTATAGENQYIIYFLPSSYDTPVFNVGGLDGGFHLDSTFEFTNVSDYKESYDVWISDNVGLGETDIKVKTKEG